MSFDTPAQAYYGDPIGAVALHATSLTPGRFSYTAAPVNDVAAMRPVTVNTVLHAGEYDLEAHFTPTAGSVGQTVTVPFVVDPAPLLIEPENKFMARGQLTPELTWVAAGFVNGDTPHSLLQSPVYSIARGRLRVGRHLIWCEGGARPTTRSATRGRLRSGSHGTRAPRAHRARPTRHRPRGSGGLTGGSS